MPEHETAAESATIAQVYQLILHERELADKRQQDLASSVQEQLGALAKTVHGGLADINVTLAGLRCEEHRADVAELATTVEAKTRAMEAEVRRRQWTWGGLGFAGGIGSVVAAIAAYIQNASK